MDKYYVFLLSGVCAKYVYALIIKPYKFFCIINSRWLHSFIFFLKQCSIIKMQSLTDLVIADHPTAVAGRFTLSYHLLSYVYNQRLVLRTFTNALHPVFSVSSIYPSANWIEREAWDMYGIKFLLHPDLRRILTDYGFQGHPLRKDFPLVGFVEVRYDDSYKCILLEPVELSQDYRFFSLKNPWLHWK